MAFCFPLMREGVKMLKISQQQIEEMEQLYPGISEQISRFEGALLPNCIHCGSSDTADVNVGIIGRTIYLCAATTKFTLVANSPKPGEYKCNSCGRYFN